MTVVLLACHAPFPVTSLPVESVKVNRERWGGEAISILLSLFSDPQWVCKILAT